MVAYKHDIPSAEVAYALLKSQETEVKIFYIPEEDITDIQNTIPDNLIPLPGTIQVHQIVTQNCDGSIFYRDVSCFCGSNNKGLCKCVNLKKHQLIGKKKTITKKRPAKIPENRNKSAKRKRNTDSTDTELDSDVTYAETSESEGYQISEDSSEDARKHTEVHIIKEKLNTEQKNKKNMIVDREITKTEEKEKTISSNMEEKENQKHELYDKNRNLTTSRTTRIKILSDIELVNALDETTGEFVLLKANAELPKVGNFVLVKFYTKQSKKIYRYVCLIEDIYGDSIVVKGLKSKKSKNIFRIVQDDISIIDFKDIIEYLPHPRKENDNYIFRRAIDVNEA